MLPLQEMSWEAPRTPQGPACCWGLDAGCWAHGEGGGLRLSPALERQAHTGGWSGAGDQNHRDPRDAQRAGRLPVSPLRPPATHGIPSWAPAGVSVDGLVLLLQSLGPSLPGLLCGVATDSILGTMGRAGSLRACGGMRTALRLP